MLISISQEAVFPSWGDT